MQLAKKIVYFLILSIFISSVEAMIDMDNFCQIKKQDHLQQFFDYKCVMINATNFELQYAVNNATVFEDLYNLSGDYGFLWLKKGEKDDMLDSIISSKKLKYDKSVIRSEIEDLQTNDFPIITSSKVKTFGSINPYKNKTGKLDIEIYGGISTAAGSSIEIGYGTLLIEFSNGEQTEQLNLSIDPGFLYANLTRYAQMSKFGQISEAYINFTGMQDEYSVYDEYEYFEGSFDITKWDYTSYIENPPAGGTSTYSQSGSQLYIYTYMPSAAGSYERYQILTMTDFTNIKNNISLLVDFYMRSNAFAGGSTNGAIRIFDGTNQINLETISATVGGCSGADENELTALRKYNINTSTMNISVYDVNNTYIKTIDASSLTGSTWYLRYYEYATAGCDGGGGTQIYIYNIGYNFNETEYSYWHQNSTTWANGTVINVGDTTVFSQSSQFDNETMVDISSAVQAAIGASDCDCTHCYLSGDYCYVPFTFYSNTGGAILYENLSINYTDIVLNVSIFNETDGGDFVIGDHNLTLFTYCENQTFETSITNQTQSIYYSCIPDYFVLNVQYGDDEYYRTLQGVESSSIDWYIPDLTKDSVVEKVLTVFDLTGSYSEGFIILEKYLDEDLITVMAHPIGADNKVNLFMIKNYHYNLKIQDNDGNIRSYGYFYASAAGEATITIPRIDFYPDATVGETVSYDWQINETSIKLLYNDSESQTSIIYFDVYNASDLSIIYSTYQTNPSFVSLGTTIVNTTTYYACFNATHSEQGQIYECKFTTKQIEAETTNDENIKTAIYWISVALVMITVVVGSGFGYVAESLLAGTVEFILFMSLGWISFGFAYNTVIIMIGTLLTVLAFWIEGNK